MSSGRISLHPCMMRPEGEEEEGGINIPIAQKMKKETDRKRGSERVCVRSLPPVHGRSNIHRERNWYHLFLSVYNEIRRDTAFSLTLPDVTV